MRTDYLTLRGCALEFDRCSFNHVDHIMAADPHCFVLTGGDVRLLVEHDETVAYASEAEGTLELFQDHRGLFFEARLQDAPHGWELADRVRNGGLREASVRFGRARVSTFESLADGRQVERVHASDLLEVSLVPAGTAAQPGTNVWQRASQGREDAAAVARWSVARLAFAAQHRRADEVHEARRGDPAHLPPRRTDYATLAAVHARVDRQITAHRRVMARGRV